MEEEDMLRRPQINWEKGRKKKKKCTMKFIVDSGLWQTLNITRLKYALDNKAVSTAYGPFSFLLTCIIRYDCKFIQQ
jgi:hypothetical protein